MRKWTAFRALCLCLAALASPARAAVSGGVSETTGNDSYQSVRANASVDIGDWTLSPDYTRYRTSFTNGAYDDYGLRLGYENGPLALGARGSVLPKVNGYSQGTAGVDATFTLSPSGSQHTGKLAGPDTGVSGGASSAGLAAMGADGMETFSAGLGRADIGVSANEILHQDDLMTVGSNPFGATTGRGKTFDLGQTDLSVYGGLDFLFTELSAQVTKSAYDRTLDGNSLRAAPYLTLTGVDGIEQGYPDLSYNLRLKWSILPIVHPFITFTHTTYQLGESPSNAFEVGGAVSLQMLRVTAGYEHYQQTGLPSGDFLMLGAGLNFGS
ncbi:MAG: hypothetical protein HKL90_11340 [Elusimicrobia bacterium]|nr:hypothetical protein [Elusimicrobiota bacterium]